MDEVGGAAEAVPSLSGARLRYCFQLSEPEEDASFRIGPWKGEATFWATLVGEEEMVDGDIPDAVKDVLEEFEDVMPPQLPKGLPPRRHIDHSIELMPGARPPAKAPYRMAPSELTELRKQLEELLDAGLIQPSKTPYGAPQSSFSGSRTDRCGYA